MNESIQTHTIIYDKYIVKDTYDAAYLMTQGAQVVRIIKRKIRENKQHKLGYREKWFIHMTNVPKSAVDNLIAGQAEVDYISFRRERLRLKRIARESY